MTALTRTALVGPLLALALTVTVPTASAQAGGAQAAGREGASGTVPDTVAAFLRASRERLYDVRAAGLRSVAFRVPVRAPGPDGQLDVLLGTVDVRWEEGQEPVFSPQVGTELPPPLDSLAGQLEGHLVGQGQQVLGFLLNDLVSGLAEGYEPRVEGAEGALTRIRFQPRAGAPEGQPPVDWLFDANRVPVVLRMEMPLGGGPGGQLSIHHAWRPAGGDEPRLVLDRLTMVQPADGPLPEATTSFQYTWDGPLCVLTGFTESMEAPGLDEPLVNQVQLESVLVNGRPLGSGDPLAPADGEAGAGEAGGAGSRDAGRTGGTRGGGGRDGGDRDGGRR